ncbi:MAG: heavy-metal-associated domain-containing protein [Acidobacteriota bacterium]
MAAVRRAVKGVDGVIAARVSLRAMEAEVQCRKGEVQPEALVQAVEAAGFKARLAGTQEPAAAEPETSG